MTKKRIKASDCWEKKSCVKVGGGEMEENEEKNEKLPSPSASTSHFPSHSHLPLLFPFSLPTHTFPILTSHPSLSLPIITWFPRIFPLLQPTPLHIHLQKGLRKGYFQPFLDMAETCIVMNWACESGHFLIEIQSVRGPSIWPYGIFSRSPRLHA